MLCKVRLSQPPERQCELGNPGGYRADLRDACGSSDIIRPVLSAPGPLPCLGQIPPFLLGWALIPALLTTVLFLLVAALGSHPSGEPLAATGTLLPILKPGPG